MMVSRNLEQSSLTQQGNRAKFTEKNLERYIGWLGVGSQEGVRQSVPEQE